MSSNFDLSSFAARLRKFIRASGRNAFSSGRHLASSEPQFNSLSLELFALQFQHNPPYRQYCESQRVRPENVEHWSRIPAVPASAFKELPLSCLPVEQRTTTFHSSGTTNQQSSRHFHNAESLSIYEESLLAWFPLNEAAAARAGDIRARPLLILTPPPAQAPHSSLVHMFETLKRNFGSTESAYTGFVDGTGAWMLDLPATIELLRKFQDSHCPALLLGTAFSYVHLLDDLAGRALHFELPSGSRAMETGGYKGRSRVMPKAELHSLIARALQIPRSHILCEYGMSELSSQAYEWSMEEGKSEMWFQFPPWARAQIISPETGSEVAEGETGLIRVFDLANVFSVMAVQTEDLGIRRGRNFELVGRAAVAEPRGCSLMAVP